MKYCKKSSEFQLTKFELSNETRRVVEEVLESIGSEQFVLAVRKDSLRLNNPLLRWVNDTDPIDNSFEIIEELTEAMKKAGFIREDAFKTVNEFKQYIYLLDSHVSVYKGRHPAAFSPEVEKALETGDEIYADAFKKHNERMLLLSNLRYETYDEDKISRVFQGFFEQSATPAQRELIDSLQSFPLHLSPAEVELFVAGCHNIFENARVLVKVFLF